MIVAGIGCRHGCPAADIVALVRQVGGADALAAPSWKRDEPGLQEAARTLGLPLRFVDGAALAAVQSRCPTRSAAVERATGFASVAEAAALAGGGVLRQPRIGSGWATVALVERAPPPNPLPEGEGFLAG
jgi:cobalamin biosynthesis protein CbiG